MPTGMARLTTGMRQEARDGLAGPSPAARGGVPCHILVGFARGLVLCFVGTVAYCGCHIVLYF